MNITSLLKTSIPLFAIRVLGLSITLLLSLYISNQFGPAITGQYYLFISTLTGLSIFGKIGLDKSLIKYCSQLQLISNEKKIRSYWFISLCIAFATSMVLLLIIYILNYYDITRWLKLSYSILFFVSITLIPYTFFGLTVSIIRGIKKLIAASLFEIFMLPLLSLVLLFSYDNFYHSRAIFIAYFSSTLLLLILSSAYLNVKLKKNKGLKRIDIPNLMSTSIPILGIDLLTYMSGWGVTYILAIYHPLETVGIYNVCWRIVTLLGILVIIFNNVNAPVISREYKQGNSDYVQDLIRNTSFTVSLLGAPAIILILTYSDYILSFFGSEFVAGDEALKILVIGQLFSFFTGSVGYLLLMSGKERQLRRITLVVCLAQIMLYFIFVPNGGLLAAAYITALSIIARNILSVIVAYRELGILSLPLPVGVGTFFRKL